MPTSRWERKLKLTHELEDIATAPPLTRENDLRVLQKLDEVLDRFILNEATLCMGTNLDLQLFCLMLELAPALTFFSGPLELLNLEFRSYIRMRLNPALFSTDTCLRGYLKGREAAFNDFLTIDMRGRMEEEQRLQAEVRKKEAEENHQKWLESRRSQSQPPLSDKSDE